MHYSVSQNSFESCMRTPAPPTLEVVWHRTWNILLWSSHAPVAIWLLTMMQKHISRGTLLLLVEPFPATLLSSAHLSIAAWRRAQTTHCSSDFWLNCLSPLTEYSALVKKIKQASVGSQSPSVRTRPKKCIRLFKDAKNFTWQLSSPAPILKRECTFLPRLRESKGTNPGTFI